MNFKKRMLNLVNNVKESMNMTADIKLILFRFSNIKMVGKKYRCGHIPVPLYISSMAESLKYNNMFLFYNVDIWKDATDQELKGNIAHELSHFLFMKSDLCKRINPWNAHTNPIVYSANECIVDLIATTHGYIDDLIASRKYLSKKLVRIQKVSPLEYFKDRKKYRNGESVVGIPIDTFKLIKNWNFDKEKERINIINKINKIL